MLASLCSSCLRLAPAPCWCAARPCPRPRCATAAAAAVARMGRAVRVARDTIAVIERLCAFAVLPTRAAPAESEQGARVRERREVGKDNTGGEGVEK